MQIFRNIVFGLIYSAIYAFLAIMSTGGGHVNSFLLAPLLPMVLILIALGVISKVYDFAARVVFVALMSTHYLATIIFCWGVRMEILDDIADELNRPVGWQSILFTSAFYLLGQTVIWIAFVASIRNNPSVQQTHANEA
jgi:hypothetical protein